jgi:transcriptional regulator with XRE-family HTH domain
VRESGTVDNARRTLGANLAAFRRAAGYSQAELASLTDYSRSTIANVETGRQHVPRGFWESADTACHAGGALIEANKELEAMARHEREEAARQMRPSLLTLAEIPEFSFSEISARAPEQPQATSVHGDGWPDGIAIAASEAREHAARAAVTAIGPGAVEQVTADVVRLSRAYVSTPPLPVFAAMYQALHQVQAALDQKAYPAQARELNFLAGALCGLMANACLDLGREEAADDLARAAWTHGRIIDHDPLMGWARGTQALAGLWDQRYLDAVRHAENGLTHLSVGMGAVRLHAIHARALAAMGDQAPARVAMIAAERARANTDHDELSDVIGGEFAFDDAKLQYYQAIALLDSEDPVQAERAAAAAIRLYQAVPERARSYGCAALARVQLARAQLMSGNLDEAAESLGAVLALDPQRRISSLNQFLDACRELLRAGIYHNSGTARQLDQQLVAFSGASTARALPGRP